MPELSIIVPVYKVEEYLPRCLDSILAQTFKDFELILIDDGSPDRCGEIMEEYAKRDSRIVTIHQENQGVSAARNAGLRIVRGQYIGFVDPDDWIEPEMYQQLVETIRAQNTDLVCCNIYKDKDGSSVINSTEQLPFVMSRTELFVQICKVPTTINGWCVNKLYKRSLIHSYFDSEIAICEDLKFVTSYCKSVRRACYLCTPLYHYCFRNDSAMFTNNARYSVSLPVQRELVLDLKEMGKTVADAFQDAYLDSCCLCCMWTQKNKDEYYYEARRELRTYLKENWLQVLQNKRIPAKKKLVIAYWALRSLPVAMNKRA